MATEIPLWAPDITDAEIQSVGDALRSGQLSLGRYTHLFEHTVSQRVGRSHGVAVASGTAALHTVLVGLGVGPGDDVITSPFAFIANANAIIYTGARPVFVDIDRTSGNLDPQRVEEAITERTKVILATETFGNPTSIDALESLAQRHEVPLVEVACEAFGAVHKGRAVGSFGRASVFGFRPNKQITCAEGGMIVTDDDRLAAICRSLRDQGRPVELEPADPVHADAMLQHERLGFNYRMSELNAALGLAQMQRLDEILVRRREVACMYIDKLMEFPELVLPTIGPDTEMSWFVFAVRLSDPYGQKERDRITTGMRRHDVGAGNGFPPIHLQPFYRQHYGYARGDFPNAESIAARTIALPFFTRLDATQIELVTLTLQVMLQRESLLRPESEA
ncbi:MAG: polysaccharide biosynthesis protein [Phycisphaera sp.]|nr:polysaccharide biosynthesis protein [Phycisphaera sp.]